MRSATKLPGMELQGEKMKYLFVTGCCLIMSLSLGVKAETITIKRGETLSKVSSSLVIGNASKHQIILWIYENNRGAFSFNNVNSLKAGALITLPDNNSKQFYSKADATNELRRQGKEWRAGIRSKSAVPKKETVDVERIESRYSQKKSIQDRIALVQKKMNLIILDLESSQNVLKASSEIALNKQSGDTQ